MVCLGFKHHTAAAGDKALKAQTNHPLSRKNHQESVFLGTIKNAYSCYFKVDSFAQEKTW